MKKMKIEMGAGFYKTEAPSTKWIVERLMDLPSAGEHVQLYQKDHPKRTLTVSKSVLMDRRMFRAA